VRDDRHHSTAVDCAMSLSLSDKAAPAVLVLALVLWLQCYV